MNEPTPRPVNEAIPLACAMANNAGQLAAYYLQHFKLSPAEALAKVHEGGEAYAASIMGRAPDQVSWCDLEFLAEHDDAAALRRWDEVRQAAKDELASGQRAAQAVEFHSDTPWGRARFLAVRSELAEQYHPQNGMERQLIDTMAQAQTAMQFWFERMMSRANLQRFDDKKLKELGYELPPRIDDTEAIDQAAEMVDRFNKIVLRTLRALRDLRRITPAVLVQNAGQVNVGGQQVNVHRG